MTKDLRRAGACGLKGSDLVLIASIFLIYEEVEEEDSVPKARRDVSFSPLDG